MQTKQVTLGQSQQLRQSLLQPAQGGAPGFHAISMQRGRTPRLKRTLVNKQVPRDKADACCATDTHKAFSTLPRHALMLACHSGWETAQACFERRTVHYYPLSTKLSVLGRLGHRALYLTQPDRGMGLFVLSGAGNDVQAWQDNCTRLAAEVKAVLGDAGPNKQHKIAALLKCSVLTGVFS